MLKSQELADKLATKRESIKALLAKNDATDEELTQADTLMAQIPIDEAEYQKAVSREAFAADNDAKIKALSAPLTPVVHANANPALVAGGGQAAAAVKAYVPASTGMVTSVKNFKGQGAEERAYKFGQWFLSCVIAPLLPDGPAKFKKNIDWVNEHTSYIKDHNEAFIKAQNEVSNLDGGALVPPEFDRDMIDLRERYGVFRKYAKMVPMAADIKTVARRVNGLTAYFTNDNQAITESQKGWDNVNLIAKKLAVLAKFSSEVAEDAIINMGDDLAGEIAYAFSLKEDQCGFVGDGSVGYGGIVGLTNALKNLSSTIAYIAGLQVGTGNAYSELTLPDFEGVVGLLPEYADTPNTRWFVHKTFYHTVMERLMLAAGGVTSAEVRDGQRTFKFLGYDVVFTQVMPRVEANSQVCALLGDLRLSSRFGDRRRNTIALDTSLGFANDQWTIRGTERLDINNSEVGNATSVAADRVAGPICGLITAAS